MIKETRSNEQNMIKSIRKKSEFVMNRDTSKLTPLGPQTTVTVTESIDDFSEDDELITGKY